MAGGSIHRLPSFLHPAKSRIRKAMTTADQVAPLDPAAAAPMPAASRLIGAIAVGVAPLHPHLDTFKAALGNIGKNDCGACHQDYRLKKS